VADRADMYYTTSCGQLYHVYPRVCTAAHGSHHLVSHPHELKLTQRTNQHKTRITQNVSFTNSVKKKNNKALKMYSVGMHNVILLSLTSNIYHKSMSITN